MATLSNCNPHICRQKRLIDRRLPTLRYVTFKMWEMPRQMTDLMLHMTILPPLPAKLYVYKYIRTKIQIPLLNIKHLLLGYNTCDCEYGSQTS